MNKIDFSIRRESVRGILQASVWPDPYCCGWKADVRENKYLFKVLIKEDNQESFS